MKHIFGPFTDCRDLKVVVLCFVYKKKSNILCTCVVACPAHLCSQDPILRLRFTTPALKNFTCLTRSENKNILFYFEKRSSLLQRWRCSCKFKSRRIGSRQAQISSMLLNLTVSIEPFSTQVNPFCS
jgi:hypothetical protein